MRTSFTRVSAASRLVAASLLSFSAVSPLHAATLNIGGTVSMFGDLRINDGLPPDDIDIPPGLTTALTGTTDSAVDTAATNTDDSYSQVGNPFTDPPTPFIATAFDETAVPGGDSARGFYYVESTTTPESGPGGRPAVLERTLTGTATLDFGDLTADAGASSDFEIARDLVLTNTSATTAYAFSIGGGWDLNLTASADDLGSMSVAEAVYSLSFISTGTVFLSAAPPAISTILDDTDPGTDITETLITSGPLFDGVNYQASVSATGTGAPTEASLDATGRFLFSVQMNPGSTLRLSFFQSQQTQTSYVAPLPPVPLPATGLALLTGLGAFGAARRKRR